MCVDKRKGKGCIGKQQWHATQECNGLLGGVQFISVTGESGSAWEEE